MQNSKDSAIIPSDLLNYTPKQAQYKEKMEKEYNSLELSGLTMHNDEICHECPEPKKREWKSDKVYRVFELDSSWSQDFYSLRAFSRESGVPNHTLRARLKDGQSFVCMGRVCCIDYVES